MTKEFIRQINKALALVSVFFGGCGMLLCVPFFLVNNWTIIGVTGIVFLAGAVLYGTGELSMAILIQQEA